MNENDVIAEYVKNQHPELLKTFDFATFRFKFACANVANDFKKAFSNLDFSGVIRATRQYQQMPLVGMDKMEHEIIHIANDAFMDSLRPIIKELSEIAPRPYYGYLEQAKDMLLEALPYAEILEYFQALLKVKKTCKRINHDFMDGNFA